MKKTKLLCGILSLSAIFTGTCGLSAFSSEDKAGAVLSVNAANITLGKSEEQNEHMIISNKDTENLIFSGKTKNQKAVLLGDTVEKVTVETNSSDAKLKLLAEKGTVRDVSLADGAKFSSLEILSNKASVIENVPSGSNIWYLDSHGDDHLRVDTTDNAGTYGVSLPYGGIAYATSADGTVYVAGDYSSSDEQYATHYELDEYSDYINYRKPLANTYKKLTADKELTVVYFGGSVTAGYGSENGKCWRTLIGEWLDENFPEAKIKHINRASGESGTYLGTFRVQRDVIAHKPDLMFLEYSINDKYYGASEAQAALQYETIVREVKEALPDCDIVTILVTDSGVADAARTVNGGVLHEAARGHEKMSEIYGIPTLHVGRALADTLPEGWTYEKDWQGVLMLDIVHPLYVSYELYYKVIREYMHNSLLCTDYDAHLMRREELPAVQSKTLLDGDRTLIQPTKDLFEKCKEQGTHGFTYSSGSYGVHDYNGYFNTTDSEAEFAFEFTGTEIAMHVNIADSNARFHYKVDDGKYRQQVFKSHNPTIFAKGLEPGKHVITIKPNFKTFPSGTSNFRIGIIFTRDDTKATKQGEVFTYTDYENGTLKVPAGSYDVEYSQAKNVSELRVPNVDGKLFLGWKTPEGKKIPADGKIEKGMILVPEYADISEYLEISGIQTKDGKDAIPFRIVSKTKGELSKLVTVVSYGTVIAPSRVLGDKRSYADYAPGTENCTDSVIGAEKLLIGAKYEYGGEEYGAVSIDAEKTDSNGQYYIRLSGDKERASYCYYTVKAYVTYTTSDGISSTAYTLPFRTNGFEILSEMIPETKADKDSAEKYAVK